MNNEAFHKKPGDRVHFLNLVALLISENDMQLQTEREDSLTYQTALLTNPESMANKSAIGFANTLFDLQQGKMSMLALLQNVEKYCTLSKC